MNKLTRHTWLGVFCDVLFTKRVHVYISRKFQHRCPFWFWWLRRKMCFELPYRAGRWSQVLTVDSQPRPPGTARLLEVPVPQPVR